MIFLFLKVEEGAREGILVYNFKGCSTDIVKNYVNSFKSSDEDYDDEYRHELVYFQIIGCEITPKYKPLETFLREIIKGCHRHVHDLFILDAPKKTTA